MRTLSQVLRETSERYPERNAILDPGGVTLTYRQLSAVSYTHLRAHET